MRTLTSQQLAARMACCDRTARRTLEAWAAVWDAHGERLFAALVEGRQLPALPTCPRPRRVRGYAGPNGGRPRYEVETADFERWVFGLSSAIAA